MTSKSTREENVQAVFDLKAGYTLGLADVEILKRVARMALAAMDSEPVAEVLSNRPGNDTSTIDRALPVGTQLYRHAQQLVVPPMQHWEELCREYPDMSIGDAIIRAAWWNHCRAAMLQAGNSPAHSGLCPEQGSAPPAQDGCSPAQNQGWIPVGERMPGSQEWVIVFAKWANQQVLCWDDVQNRWTDFEDQSYYADMFSHWMPLPAAPQEVKGE
ncbi:DUF551 domain-containing protein [Raoultella ornithinolytica]|uniref:DUF551 domain-containing protein n=1 Tax=Raoultella ornithinolytica TaxID=54291 RepID=UPI001CC9A845|nr:DUF551 domain-containing protein [Raoultella ornithinolytica]